MRRRSAHMRLDALDASVRDLTRDVSVLKTDVSVLKTDVSVLKTDVSVLKTDVAGLKTDVAEFKGDVAREFAVVKTMMELHAAELRRELTRRFTELLDFFGDRDLLRDTRSEDHESRLRVLENRVDRIEREKP